MEYPGVLYHVIQRGNNKEHIFERTGDKEYLIEQLRKSVAVDGIVIRYIHKNPVRAGICSKTQGLPLGYSMEEIASYIRVSAVAVF
ncbi:MAG: hypothetical protein ACOY46_13490 [Bacillota bacterium]